MKKIYLLSLCLLASSIIYSQKEMNNWVFGISNLMDFNTDPITIGSVPNFNFFSERNSVSMSDEDGELLFYCDGNSIFDKTHNFMPNGFITSNFSAAHPIFVIPKPNSDHGYYMIINSNGFAGPFLHWIEIDMTLNGGLGDVVTTAGDILVDNPTSKTTAVLHSNLQDIWVVSHEMGSDVYNAWLATENGISDIPVTSAVGSVIELSGSNSGNGQIKTSHDGNKIVAANQEVGNVEIFNFDRSTGELSNPVTIDSFNLPYGIEFSPSGRYLYVTHQNLNFQSELVQLDLFSSDPIAIQNSAQVIGFPFSLGGSGALQLAPDEKIYVANPFDFSLGVIASPDLPGDDCEFNEFGVFLNDGQVIFGLPSFFHKYFQTPYFNYDGFCSGGVTTFSIDAFDIPVDSVSWNFGDPNSGNNNTSTLLNPSHNFPGTGTYQVTLTLYAEGQTFINEGVVHIAPTELNFGSDQTLCSNADFNLDAFTPNATYLWSDNSTQPSLNIETPGTYWVEVSIGNCPTLMDTINIDHIPAPDADLGGNGGLCNGDAVTLTTVNQNPNADYQWSTGSTTSSITIFFGGQYSVTVTNPNGCTDTDDVFYSFDQVLVNPSQANLQCHGDSNGVALVFPAAGSLPFSYEWSDGDTLYTNNQLPAGDYTVTITDALGCTNTQDFTITQPSELIVDAVINADNPNTSNPDGAVLLQPSGGSPPYTFYWDVFGVVGNPLMNDLENGIYNITITDDNDCEKIIEVNVGGPVSTEEISFLENIKLFPNPTNDFLFVKIPITQNEDLEISITNTLGQPVSENYFLEKGKTDFSIQVSDWSSGIYFLKMKTKTEEKILKFNVFE